MADVTQMLSKVEAGDSKAAEQLLALVYEELRKLAAAKLANENPGQTLQATALVHEAYLRLVDAPKAQNWNNRGHFFAAAAEAMRRILVDNARRKQSQKHGGGLLRQAEEPEYSAPLTPLDPTELLGIHEVLDLLAESSPRKAELVKLRYFLGCTIVESAKILGIAPATAEQDWTYAKAWLRRKLQSEADKITFP